MKLAALFGARSPGKDAEPAESGAGAPPPSADDAPPPVADPTEAPGEPAADSTATPSDPAAERSAVPDGGRVQASGRAASRVPPAGSMSSAPRVVPTRPDLIMTPFLANSDMAVSFADPSLPDSPLTHVNDAFCALTRHPRERCVARNCRFLQGKLTQRPDVEAIRRGIEEDRYLITRLLNYRRDGELFDNVLQIGQLRDTSGRTKFLFGLQWDVTRTLDLLGGSSIEARLEDRTMSRELRRLARLANRLVVRSNELGVGAAGVPLVERLVAMSRPFQFPTPGARRDRATLRALLEYLVEPHLDVPGARFRVRGVDGEFSTDIAGPLALWLHELASASRAYGAFSQPSGVVVLSWAYTFEFGRPWIEFHWHEMKLSGLPAASLPPESVAENRTGGNGARVVREVIEAAGGNAVIREWDQTIDASLVLPNDGGIAIGTSGQA